MSQNPYLSAVAQVEQIRPYLEMTDLEFERLITHDQIVERSLSIKLDSGKEKVFKALRAQHNNALGPYKGGLRFHPLVSREEVMALSMWMTWKTAIVGLPLGGGKGGIIVDPKTLSNNELKRLSKAFARRFADVWGSQIDVPAPDVNTNPEIMNWMVEECRLTKGRDVCRATFTGKPLDEGGSQGRVEATGRGGFYILKLLAAQHHFQPKQTTIAVQGIGNVAYWFARLALEAGYQVVAVSDSKGGVTALPQSTTFDSKVDQEHQGFTPQALEELIAYKEAHGSIAGHPDYLAISNEELLALPVDILVPAALDNVITDQNVESIKAPFIIELANGPISSQADHVLQQRGVEIVPDILANAGGVTVSYFEWRQNIAETSWSEQMVNQKLARIMKKAFTEVMAQRQVNPDMSLRQAAYTLAVTRVLTAMRKKDKRRISD